ncbi:MAG: glutathione S-transferase [Roseovarius sp.]|nr:glutathione S-transferase [Roseovarius sp.]MCY4290868.1 glutathione S-transferase [Roseovarius sp.]MCY4314742.1 glutathione S-transferase [Roseovarius sp.]
MHHVPMSRSFRVIWLLEELGLDYETKIHSIRDGDLRDPAFREISPAGRVPAIEMDGLVMAESGAILQYLCENFPEADLAPGTGDSSRPRYLELMGMGETIGALVENLNLQHVFLRNPEDVSPVVVKIITARLRGALTGMSKMLGKNEYMLPTGFSAADIMMASNLYSAPYYVKMDEFPALERYRVRLSAREGFKRASARDGKQDFYDRDFYPIPEK